MIERDSWGHSYFVVRAEILGFTKDELLRKHLPRGTVGVQPKSGRQ